MAPHFLVEKKGGCSPFRHLIKGARLWQNGLGGVDMKKWLVAAGLAALLVGCSADEEAQTNSNSADDGNSSNENNAINHSMENDTVGFVMDDEGNTQQADVPEQEAEEILAAFNEYIAAFNSEDLERYGEVLSENPESFDKEEDLIALEKAFETYTTVYETADETIVKYEEGRAEVFANITVSTEEKSTGRSVEQGGRQVVVFHEEDGKWKVTSLHFIGNS